MRFAGVPAAVCFPASCNTGSWPRLKGDLQGALRLSQIFLGGCEKDSPDEDGATGHQDDRVMKGLHAYLMKGRYTGVKRHKIAQPKRRPDTSLYHRTTHWTTDVSTSVVATTNEQRLLTTTCSRYVATRPENQKLLSCASLTLQCKLLIVYDASETLFCQTLSMLVTDCRRVMRWLPSATILPGT